MYESKQPFKVNHCVFTSYLRIVTKFALDFINACLIHSPFEFVHLANQNLDAHAS